MNTMRVLIVIVNYGTPALTLDCVESLRATLEHFPNTELLLVDNGSRDSSLSQFHAAEIFQSRRAQIRILPLPKNAGYAAGNNAAIRAALADDAPPDFVWLLNSDTQVRANALDALIAAMQTNPRMGIASSRSENADASPQSSAFRFPTIYGEWEANVQWRMMTRLFARWVIAPPPPLDASRADWVSGASMLIRRTVLEQIGLLDEKFFMYYEDVDFCHRAQNAGWETWYIPASRVVHRVGASSNVPSAQRNQYRVPRYWFEARRQYFLKHHGKSYALCADAAWLVGFGLRRVRQFIQRSTDLDARALWRDFFAYSFLRRGT